MAVLVLRPLVPRRPRAARARSRRTTAPQRSKRSTAACSDTIARLRSLAARACPSRARARPSNSPSRRRQTTAAACSSSGPAVVARRAGEGGGAFGELAQGRLRLGGGQPGIRRRQAGGSSPNVAVEDGGGPFGQVGQREAGPVPVAESGHPADGAPAASPAPRPAPHATPADTPSAQRGRSLCTHQSPARERGGIDACTSAASACAAQLGEGHDGVRPAHRPPPADPARPRELIPEGADDALQVSRQPVDGGGEIEQVGVAKGRIAGHGVGQQRSSLVHPTQLRRDPPLFSDQVGGAVGLVGLTGDGDGWSDDRDGRFQLPGRRGAPRRASTAPGVQPAGHRPGRLPPAPPGHRPRDRRCRLPVRPDSRAHSRTAAPRGSPAASNSAPASPTSRRPSSTSPMRPRQQAAEVELDSRSRRGVGRALQHLLNGAHGPNARLGAGVGTVVHDPLGLERHGLENPLPAPVASRHQFKEGVKEGERLAVMLAASAWCNASHKASIASSSPGSAARTKWGAAAPSRPASASTRAAWRCRARRRAPPMLR